MHPHRLHLVVEHLVVALDWADMTSRDAALRLEGLDGTQDSDVLVLSAMGRPQARVSCTDAAQDEAGAIPDLLNLCCFRGII